MKWFGYVWIAILVIMWLVWTIKCIKDFITDYRYFRARGGLDSALELETSWIIWIAVHVGVIFISSLIWFIYSM